MTLPPSQNQYPGWQPPTQPAQPQSVSPTTTPTQPMAPVSNTGQAAPAAKKLNFKGPMIAFGALVLILIIITVVALVASKKPTKTNQSQTSSNSTTQTSGASSNASNSDTADNTYTFIDNQQEKNLQNLATRITTNQSQNQQRQAVPATASGWAALNPSDIIDPITNQPYSYTTSTAPNVGQVQYVASSVCSSDNQIIPSTNTASFALRTQLYNGTFYCVDTSNSGH